MISENDTSITYVYYTVGISGKAGKSLESGSAGHQLNLLSSTFLILF